MKLIFITTLFITQSIFAGGMFQNAKINNAHFEFSENKGRFETDGINAQTKSMDFNIDQGQLLIERFDNNWNLIYQDLEVNFFTDDNSMLNGTEYFLLEQVYLDYMATKKLQLNVLNGLVNIGDGNQAINDFRLLCTKSEKNKSNALFDDILAPCLDFGAMSIKNIRIAKESTKSTKKFFNTRSSNSTDIKNTYLKIENKQVYAQFYTDYSSFKNVKVSIKGSIEYQESKNEYKLTIDEARVNGYKVILFKNIRDLLMDAIRGSGLKSIRVQGYSIYFNL